MTNASATAPTGMKSRTCSPDDRSRSFPRAAASCSAGHRARGSCPGPKALNTRRWSSVTSCSWAASTAPAKPIALERAYAEVGRSGASAGRLEYSSAILPYSAAVPAITSLSTPACAAAATSRAGSSTFTTQRTSGEACFGLTPAAARCTTTSTSPAAPSVALRSARELPSTSRSRRRTSHPAVTSEAWTWRPRNPEAPVSTTRG